MGKSAKGTQSSKSNTAMEPWAPTQPYLKDLLGLMGDAGGIGISPDQQMAYSALKNNALMGDPWAQNKANQTNWLYGQAGDQGRVGQAYNQWQQGMQPYMDGSFLDPMNNPQMKEMLDLVGNNAFNKVNSAFAGAGRTLTGNAYGQKAAARGVAEAQLPVLFDQFNKQQQMQQQALGQLLPMAQGATDAQGLYGAQAGEMGQNAIDARNYSGERLIDLDQQIKSMPYEDIALIASILYPGAGLGGTSNTDSKGTSKTKTSFFSDRRLKENIREIGETYDGQKIYAYNHIGSEKTQIGLMADEVQKVKPEAISMKAGFYMVDYGIALEGSEKND